MVGKENFKKADKWPAPAAGQGLRRIKGENKLWIIKDYPVSALSEGRILLTRIYYRISIQDAAVPEYDRVIEMTRSGYSHIQKA